MRFIHSLIVAIVCFYSSEVPAQIETDFDSTQIRPAVETKEIGNVDIQKLDRILTAPRAEGFAVQYAYEFPGREAVEITGLGTVPSKGNFKYLSQRGDLIFRDPDSRQVLRRIVLSAATVTNSLFPLPQPSEFPNAYRAFRWEPSISLQEKAQEILGKHNFKYSPIQWDDKFYLTTTYAPLKVSDENEYKTARIALLISYPYSKTKKGYEFRVTELVKEGRSHSGEFRETTDPEIIKAATDFVDNLIGEMRSGQTP